MQTCQTVNPTEINETHFSVNMHRLVHHTVFPSFEHYVGLPPDLQTMGVISSNGCSMLNMVGKDSLKRNCTTTKMC